MRQGRYEGKSNPLVASMFGSIIPAAWSFMLAARSRGLGTVWTTFHLMHEREAAEILGIPYDEVTQVALIPVAYTIGTEFKPGKRKPLDSMVHWDRLVSRATQRSGSTKTSSWSTRRSEPISSSAPSINPLCTAQTISGRLSASSWNGQRRIRTRAVRGRGPESLLGEQCRSPPRTPPSSLGRASGSRRGTR